MAKVDRLLKEAKAHFESGEKALVTVLGAYEIKLMGTDTVRNGILVATDLRLLFFAKKLGGFDLEVFPYQNISSIEMGKNLMGHRISLFASGNKVEMKWINQGEVKDFVDTVKRRISDAHTAPVPASTSGTVDPVDQLRRLGELHQAGVITQAEFEAKKKEILGRI